MLLVRATESELARMKLVARYRTSGAVCWATDASLGWVRKASSPPISAPITMIHHRRRKIRT